jgi:RNA polymerase sigma factor (sigma-70 family)
MKNSWTGGEAVCSMACAEENLALAVHRMETGAFERLIDRHESSLFNFAHSILQNTADAQEVVQDAMLRAHRALTRQYDEARCATLALRPWLLRITRNLCLNRNRSKCAHSSSRSNNSTRGDSGLSSEVRRPISSTSRKWKRFGEP